MQFTKNDIQQFEDRGIDNDLALWQLEMLTNGVKPSELHQAVTPKLGIYKIEDEDELIKSYKGSKYKVTKFVPASGAASRMFKALFEFIEEGKNDISEAPALQEFFGNIEKFAFYDDLSQAVLPHSIDDLILKKEYITILKALLNEDGLNYGQLPKGLLKFHGSGVGATTPFEEHLIEGAKYAISADGIVNLHFTVSPEHMAEFEAIKKKLVSNYEQLFNVKYNISFSVQKTSTDTMALTSDNELFYEDGNHILFRPGGHGALIENLNDIDSDIIFIKNIDNVKPSVNTQDTVRYKKILAGVLVQMKEMQDKLIRNLRKGSTGNAVSEAIQFIDNVLNIKSLGEKPESNILIDRLNRPMRICGIVGNIGDPGGGPFLTRDTNGVISPQIVETSQIDLENTKQKEIFNQSTHFNPVDLFCAVIDVDGNKFNLKKYVDNNTCFISHKSKSGRDLKALELPGLWNGAMAGWNTIFVEVPSTTFTPVKTVNDLLKNVHQL